MEKIALLDSETIDRIAAGEVVERPSSVVKELTENAIDAGATAVTVEIRSGGKTLIRVTDNGCGIESDLVPLAFERHTTSKLRRIEDLGDIQTLGFRGEALSSVAAVSRTECMTRTAQSLTGTLFRMEGGVAEDLQQIGLPQGTTILVKDLFYNVPARRKFLKTDQTEGAYISDLMEELSLSHPQIAFKFIADGKTKLQTAGGETLKNVIYRIYGKRIADNLIEIHEEKDPYRISGFLGAPSLSRGTRRFESVFVNGRYIKDKILQKGLEDGYKRYLMQHQFPFAVLFFETLGDLVDVNVHPAKALVRFSDEKKVYDFVFDTVSAALRRSELIEEIPLERKNENEEIFSPRAFGAALPDPAVRESPEPYEFSRLSEKSADSPPAVQPSSEPSRAVRESAVRGSAAADAPASFEQAVLAIPDTKRLRFRLIGSLFDTYWLLEYDEKLYMIDQHAAHERVNYERLLARFHSGNIASQQIFPAIPVTLSEKEITLLNQYLPYLSSCGFRIDHFGGNEYRICAVPTELYGMNAESFFLSFFDEINDLSTGRTDPDTITDRLAQAACKESIKGHDVISPAQAQLLLEELFACDDPYHCPHGRPTLVSMTKSEIEKLFRRITP